MQATTEEDNWYNRLDYFDNEDEPEEKKMDKARTGSPTLVQNGAEFARARGDAESESERRDAQSPGVAEQPSSEESDECMICFEDLERQHRAVPRGCRHRFCLVCIITSMEQSNKCPLDQQRIKEIVVLDADDNETSISG